MPKLSAGLPFLKKRKQKTFIPASTGHRPEPRSTMPKLFSRPSFSEEKEAKDFYSSYAWALPGAQLHDAQTFRRPSLSKRKGSKRLLFRLWLCAGRNHAPQCLNRAADQSQQPLNSRESNRRPYTHSNSPRRSGKNTYHRNCSHLHSCCRGDCSRHRRRCPDSSPGSGPRCIPHCRDPSGRPGRNGPSPPPASPGDIIRIP